MILLSSCLIGINCRYNSTSNEVDKLLELVKNGQAVFMCPEQTGGLPTPREPAEIEKGKTAKDVLEGNGKIVTKSGQDVTQQFLEGAKRTLAFCKELNCTKAILKARSPSCSSTLIYDGTFSGNKVVGNGLTAELLKQNGIEVYDEDTFQSANFL